MMLISLKTLMKISIVCLFSAALAFAHDESPNMGTHKIFKVFSKTNDEQIVVMRANDLNGPASDSMRVYTGSLEAGFGLLEIARIRVFRGSQATLITLKNGEVLNLGYMGRSSPSIGSTTLIPISITPEILVELSTVVFPSPNKIMSCRNFYGS